MFLEYLRTMTDHPFRSLLAEPLEAGSLRGYDVVLLREGYYAEALTLAFDSDPQVAFRASAALEYAFFENPERFDPYLPGFLKNYLTVTNRSAHRHYSKILVHLLKWERLPLTDAQAEQVAEISFDRLIDPQAKPAVQAWLMDILFMLSARLPWVAEHLEETVRHLMDSADSPGIQSRGAKVLRKIRSSR